MEAPLYQYQPLQHIDSVRILVLHPSPNESEFIACTLLHERLSSITPYPRLYPELFSYEAVSYTWGDSTQTNTIYFNDGKARLSIGTNCHAALRRLRLAHKDRTVWIDAVCIDQKNLQERGHQVCMMKEVYDRALCVIVMLSDVIPDSRLLLDELAEVSDILESGANLVRARPSAAIVQQLEVLFKDPWFNRTWVLQEACTNPHLTLVYGSAIILFKALVKLYFGYDSNTMVTMAQWPRPLELAHRDQRKYTTPEFSLWRQLYEARHCQATDPRDKVFALKSLVGPRQSELDLLIDYTRSVEDTFQRVATYLLPVVGLRILSATRHPHSRNMASWIPDWSQTLPLHYNAFYDERDDARVPEDVSFASTTEKQESTRLSYSCREFGNTLELIISGYRYDQVVECSTTFHFVDMYDARNQMDIIYNSLPNIRQHLVAEGTCDATTVSTHFSQDILKAMSLMDGLDLHFGLTRRSAGGSLSLPDQREVSDFYEALQDCAICLFGHGELAIVPGDAQPGDVVCIMFGAMAPCVLRPDRDGCWILVSGDCHVLDLGMTDVARMRDYVSMNLSSVENFILR